MKNIDLKNVESFGEKWLKHDQSGVKETVLIFKKIGINFQDFTLNSY